MDPFGRLPSDILEMIISNFRYDGILTKLCQASPVFRHQFNTSKLLKTWKALHKEMEYTLFRMLVLLVTYPKIEEPIPRYESTDAQGCPNICWLDPLFTPQQHLIFEMHASYQRMTNCFALGPSLAPLYRSKYPDFYFGHFSDYLAKSFGEHGEHLPPIMPPIESGMRYRIFYLLLAIETMEQCPSAFVTSPSESPKQLSIREERFRRLACVWIMQVPGAIWHDRERFFS